MAYYVRILPSGDADGVWEITDTFARCVSHPGSLTEWAPMDGLSMWDTLRARLGWFMPENPEPFRVLRLEPGQYYPRMVRPFIPETSLFPADPVFRAEDQRFIASSLLQLDTMRRHLDEICRTVEPDTANMNAFGHSIRNLLILASTEVEMHWRGILQANGMMRTRYTTNDYVALREAMKLYDFSVRFLDYPWLGDFAPFANWNPTNPTGSLAWYAAYNAVKHDREKDFPQASLGNAFDAVAAIIVIMAAQFGRYLGMNGGIISVEITRFPFWPVEECYSPAVGGVETVATPFPF